MTTVTVTEDLNLPAGVNPRGITVTIFLAGEDGKPLPAGYATVAGQTIIGQHQFNPATDGTWSKALNPNADITPAGTVWGVKLSGPGNAGVSSVPRFGLVPGAGPVTFQSILTDPPGDLPSSALSAEIARATAAEGVLTSGLATEVTARTTADGTLAMNLATEVTNRTSAVSGEATTRATADATLAASVTAESAARLAAESVLRRMTGATGRPMYMLPIGDSEVLGGQAGTGDTVADNIYGDTWPNYAGLLSMGRLRTVANAGVAGNTSTQMLARLTSDVFTPLSNAGIVHALVPFLIGVNDNTTNTGTGTDTLAAAVTIANDETAVQRILDAGHVPVIVTVPPTTSNSDRFRIALINDAKKRLARRYGVPVVDAHSVLVDTTTGLYATGKNFDSTHPSINGYRDIGQAFVNMLEMILPSSLPELAQMNPDSTTLYNGTLNPLFLTVTSSPVPDGWSFSGGSNYTRLLAPMPILGRGNVATSIGPATASGNNNVGVTIPLAGNFAVGDIISIEMPFSFHGGDDTAGVTRAIMQMACTGATHPLYIGRLNVGADVHRGIFVASAPVPAGTTALTVSMILNGVGRLDRWNPTDKNLTALGVTP